MRYIKRITLQEVLSLNKQGCLQGVINRSALNEISMRESEGRPAHQINRKAMMIEESPIYFHGLKFMCPLTNQLDLNDMRSQLPCDMFTLKVLTRYDTTTIMGSSHN